MARRLNVASASLDDVEHVEETVIDTSILQQKENEQPRQVFTQGPEPVLKARPPPVTGTEFCKCICLLGDGLEYADMIMSRGDYYHSTRRSKWMPTARPTVYTVVGKSSLVSFGMQLSITIRWLLWVLLFGFFEIFMVWSYLISIRGFKGARLTWIQPRSRKALRNKYGKYFKLVPCLLILVAIVLIIWFVLVLPLFSFVGSTYMSTLEDIEIPDAMLKPENKEHLKNIGKVAMAVLSLNIRAQSDERSNFTSVSPLETNGIISTDFDPREMERGITIEGVQIDSLMKRMERELLDNNESICVSAPMFNVTKRLIQVANGNAKGGPKSMYFFNPQLKISPYATRVELEEFSVFFNESVIVKRFVSVTIQDGIDTLWEKTYEGDESFCIQSMFELMEGNSAFIK